MSRTTQSRPSRSAWQSRISALAAAGLVAAGLVVPSGPAWADDLPDATPPTATITAPVTDPPVEVAVGAALSAEFVCADPDSPAGEITSGIAATDGCVGEVFAAGAPEGAPALAVVESGGPLDTSAAGTFELRVTAKDAAGLTGNATVAFTVVQPAPVAAEVSGTVRDSQGVLQAGSRVEARTTGTTTLAASTTADTEGFYSMTVPAGTYDFRVAGPSGSGLGARQDGVTLTAGATTRDWTITTGLVSVSGRVLVGGQPQPSAGVALYCGASSANGLTDQQGQFTVSVLPSGSCQMSISSYLTGPNFSATITGITATTDVTLPDLNVPSHTLTVTVLNADDTPAPGYTVSTGGAPGTPQPLPIGGGLSATYSTMGTRPATTDTTGVATLTLLGTGSQGTLAIAKTGTPTINHPYTATGNTPLTVKLDAGVSVSGRVLVGGQPQPSAGVALYCGASSANGLTDQQGQFTVSVLPSGSCQMSISSYLTGPNFSATITGITATTDVTLPDLDVPSHTLTVTVLNADDTPAPGYTVSTGGAPGTPQPLPIGGGLSATYSTMGTRPATTDTTGVATLTLLGTGSQGTLAIARTGTPTINHPYTATGNTPLTVKLTAGVSVSGRVLVGGQPQPSAGVALYCGASSANGLTDQQGQFTVSVLPSGSCSMSISSYLTGPNFSATVTGITATTDVTLPDLDVPSHTLTVTVLNADDTPAPGYTVSTSGAPGTPQPLPIGGGLTATYSTMGTRPATTDTTGVATLTLLGTGSQGTLAIAKPGTPTINHPYTATGNTPLTVFVSGGIWVVVPVDPQDYTDQDNITAGVEALVPSLPGSTTTNGDGNGDGTADAQQANVASLPILGSTEPGANDFVTVAAPGDTKLTNVHTQSPDSLEATNELPGGASLPEGLTAFKVQLPEGPTGQDVIISIFTGSTDGVVGYAKLTPGPNGGLGTWSLLPNDRVTIYPNRVEIRLTDGGIGDADGEANGVIDDPGGPVIFTDSTPPTITIHVEGDEEPVTPPLLPTFLLGAEPTLACTATDELSGLDGPCSTELVGGNANGVGTFTYTATARDKAGNAATATFQYRVIYRVDGFAQPINDPRLVPDSTRSIFKAGSTVPVKFQVKRADGTVVAPTAAPQWLAPIKGSGLSGLANEPAVFDEATLGTEFKSTSEGWHYNWKTPKSAAGHWYTIGARLDDGTVRTVVVGLR